MKLYHGSNVIVQNPRIIESDRNLDFGKGFYLITDLEQAKIWWKWSNKKTINSKIKKSGSI